MIRLSLRQSGSRISQSGSWISQWVIVLFDGCFAVVWLLFMFEFCVGPTTMEPLFLNASFGYLLDLDATLCKQISCILWFV